MGFAACFFKQRSRSADTAIFSFQFSILNFMKILLLTTHLDMGGIPVYTVNLSRYLKRAGHEPVVVSSGGKLEEWLRDDGIEHIRMDIRTKAEFGFKVWRAIRGLRRIVREKNIDVIHSQTRITHVLGCVLDRSTGVPHVTTCHGFFKHRRLSRRLFPCWGRDVIAISKSVQAHLINDFKVSPEHVSHVYNGIDVSGYLQGCPARDRDLFLKIGLKEGVPVIGMIGRLSEVKGHRYLIEAFGELISRGDQAQLLIVGSGPHGERLKELVSSQGLADRIFFSEGGEALSRYLGLVDIYCIPSVDEGFGLSLVEAMASGRPCIASKVGGLAEIVSDGEDGILVPPCDPKAILSAVELLLREEPLRRRLAAAAREKAIKNFSIEESVANTVKVYEKAVAGARHTGLSAKRGAGRKALGDVDRQR